MYILLQEYALLNTFVDEQSPAINFARTNVQTSTKTKLQEMWKPKNTFNQRQTVLGGDTNGNKPV
jgi:hypothetical protein